MTDTRDLQADLDYLMPAERLVNLYTPGGEMPPEVAAWSGNGWKSKHRPEPAVSSRPIRVWSLADLENQPDPDWQVDGMLPEKSVGSLVGKYGSAKSLLAKDLALTRASGYTRWFGRRVKPGRVAYVAAEGAFGLKWRIAAWRRLHPDADPTPNIRIIPDPVQLMAALDLQRLVDALRAEELPFDLIILDTFNKMTPGADEKSGQDMGLALAGIDRIRLEFDCAVLFLHHPPHGLERARGHGSLTNDIDFSWFLKKDDSGLCAIRCDKMKDGPDFDPIRFRVRPLAPSCVLEPADPDAGLEPSAEAALATLRTFPDGAPFSEWLRATKLSKTTFRRARTELLDRRLVWLKGENYIITDQGAKGP